MSVRRPKPVRQGTGLTLVELVIFIAVVSIGIAGVLLVLNQTTQRSVDPQMRKQALALAEALLEEVQAMPFTDCDPEAFDLETGICARDEAHGAEGAGADQPQPEARGSLVAPFDNVNDYAGFTLAAGGTDMSGTVTAPAGYSAAVTITEEGGFGPAGAQPPQADVLRITVTVNYGSDSLVLEGYRTKYAPTAYP
ncbi:MAG: pilin protein MshD [Burkholderiales bacterium]